MIRDTETFNILIDTLHRFVHERLIKLGASSMKKPQRIGPGPTMTHSDTEKHEPIEDLEAAILIDPARAKQRLDLLSKFWPHHLIRIDDQDPVMLSVLDAKVFLRSKALKLSMQDARATALTNLKGLVAAA